MYNIFPKSERIRPKNGWAIPENLFERLPGDGRFPSDIRYYPALEWSWLWRRRKDSGPLDQGANSISRRSGPYIGTTMVWCIHVPHMTSYIIYTLCHELIPILRYLYITLTFISGLTELYVPGPHVHSLYYMNVTFLSWSTGTRQTAPAMPYASFCTHFLYDVPS